MIFRKIAKLLYCYIAGYKKNNLAIQQYSNHKLRGFTLIELMVVLSVTAVLGTLGIAGFITYNQVQILQTATSDVVSVLNLAKSRAQSQVKISALCSSSGGLEGYKVEILAPKNYTLYLRCRELRSSIDKRVDEENKTLPADLNFAQSVSFFFPVLIGGVQAPGQIVITGFGREKTIAVNSLGGVNVQAGNLRNLPSTPAPFSCSACDSTGDGCFSNADSDVINCFGQTAVGACSQRDVNRDGAINAGDISKCVTDCACSATLIPTPIPIPIPDPTKIFISYYDKTNDDLKFAKSINGGAIWNKSAIDSSGSVGEYTSIDAVSSSTIFISYFASSENALKFAKSTDGGVTWFKTPVQITGQRGGWDTSISAADANNISISYRQLLNGNMLVVIFKTSNGTFTPGGTPQHSLIDGPITAFGTSVETPSNDTNTAYVIYSTVENGRSHLKFAKFGSAGSAIDSAGPAVTGIGFGPSIKTLDAARIFVAYGTTAGFRFARSTDRGLSWTKSVIDSQGTLVRGQKSLFLIDPNTIFVSYSISSTLKFAKSTDGGVSWTTSTVDPQFGGSDAVISASDANKVFIAYYDSLNKDLKMVKSTNGGLTWTTSTIDSTGDVGSFPSIVVRQ